MCSFTLQFFTIFSIHANFHNADELILLFLKVNFTDEINVHQLENSKINQCIFFDFILFLLVLWFWYNVSIDSWLLNVNKQLDLHYICTRLYSVRLKEFKNLFEKSRKSHILTFLHRITDSDPWLWILLIIGFINLNRKTAHAPRYFFSYLSMPIRESMPLIIAIFLITRSSVQHPTIFQDKVNSLYFVQ